METFSDLSENKRHITGVETGLGDLDRLTAGWQNTDLIIIAARPSMGKTALMLGFGQHIAVNHKRPVAIFSLEMSSQQLTQRMLCSEAKVNMHAARTGRLNDQAWKNLTHAASRLGDAPIFIDDSPGMTVLEMRAKARRLKATQGLDLILVDYLQLVSGDSRAETRALELGGVSRGLKALAKELNVPVVTGAQLSRAIEQRTDRKPLLSDLRESGSIEQDADLVCFIHRPEVYDKTKPELENYAELIVGKHRNGPTDTVALTFHKEWARFDSYIDRSYDDMSYDGAPELPQ
jgi:replicative DNA helicase